MTIEEFNKTKWRAGMKAVVNGVSKPIVSVDFQKQLVGLEINRLTELKKKFE